jgi:DNA-binding HxlR family transcriptional regulator
MHSHRGQRGIQEAAEILEDKEKIVIVVHLCMIRPRSTLLKRKEEISGRSNWYVFVIDFRI